jgi:hypothetical protein
MFGRIGRRGRRRRRALDLRSKEGQRGREDIFVLLYELLPSTVIVGTVE